MYIRLWFTRSMQLYDTIQLCNVVYYLLLSACHVRLTHPGDFGGRGDPRGYDWDMIWI